MSRSLSTKLRNDGTAMASRMPATTMVINNSIMVNPRSVPGVRFLDVGGSFMDEDGRGASLLEADGKGANAKNATQFAYRLRKKGLPPVRQAVGALDSGN